jgi:hypothetical protein
LRQVNPDVHFAGFDMEDGTGLEGSDKGFILRERSRQCGIVFKRIEAKRTGLCISIAINLKNSSPFEFLIIDDPIQSWDKDHRCSLLT